LSTHGVDYPRKIGSGASTLGVKSGKAAAAGANPRQPWSRSPCLCWRLNQIDLEPCWNTSGHVTYIVIRTSILDLRRLSSLTQVNKGRTLTALTVSVDSLPYLCMWYEAISVLSSCAPARARHNFLGLEFRQWCCTVSWVKILGWLKLELVLPGRTVQAPSVAPAMAPAAGDSQSPICIPPYY
jgi:hypothetical protein